MTDAPTFPATDTPSRAEHGPIGAHHRDLEGTTTVITGAARGMGAAFARELARHGVNVVAGDITDEAMQRTADSIAEELHGVEGAGTVLPAAVDVTDPAAHQRLVDLALSKFGRLDSWVNNAGVFPQNSFVDVPPEQIDATYRVNVNSIFYGGQAAARHFAANGGGAIVNMCSVAATRVRVTRAVYNSSKAAVKHLTSTMAVELGPDNIRVNGIAPGFIDTEMTRWVQDQPELLAKTLDSLPLKRIGAPIEVFGALYFLLSDSARYVNGALIAVDGGSQHI